MPGLATGLPFSAIGRPRRMVTAARTSTYALNAATQPYVIALADKGVEGAFADDPGFSLGLNVQAGMITHPAVENALAGR